MSSETPTTFREQLGQVRHDLKTPVGHILGYSEMLQEEFDDEPWLEFESDLKHIHGSGQRLVDLIEDLLGPSKSSIDDIDFTSTQYQLRQQLNHITGYCEMLHELAEEEGRDELIPDLDRIMQASTVFTHIVEQEIRPSVLDGKIYGGSEEVINTVTAEAEREITEATELTGFNRMGEGGNILVVDDNLANCDLLVRRLGRQGYQSIAVDSGKKALGLLEKEQFDLILLDLLMPGMNGIDVLEHLKQNAVLRNIPVIVLSALDDMEMIVRCVLLGADD